MARGRWLSHRINTIPFKVRDTSIDKCPKCGRDGIAHLKFVWDGGHANGRYYIYYKHDKEDHYGNPAGNPTFGTTYI